MDKVTKTKSDATEPGRHTPVVLPKRQPAPPGKQRPNDTPGFTERRSSK